MKLTIFCLLLCLCSCFSYSQMAIAYSRSPTVFNTSALKPTPDGGWIGMKRSDKTGKGRPWWKYSVTITFQQYDANFKLLKEVDLPANAGNVSMVYSRLYQQGSKYFFVYLEGHKGDDEGSIRVMEVNPATMEFSESRVVVSFKEQDYSLTDDFHDFGYFDVIIKASPSSKSVMMLIKLYRNLFVCSLDENLKSRWIKREAKTFPPKVVRSAEVDDAGTIYIGYKLKEFGYRIYSPTGAPSDGTISFPDGEAAAILFLAKPDAVFVAGVYKKGDYCKGVYKGMINAKGEVSGIITKLFPESFIELLDTDGWANTKDKKYGLSPDFFGELKLSNDGSLIMLTEFCKMIIFPQRDVTHVGSIMHVYFGNDETSFARVPKYNINGAFMDYNEHSVSSQSRFYYVLAAPSETIILYSDNPDNLSRDIKLSPKLINPGKDIIVAARIDKHGNVRREEVIPQMILYTQTKGDSMTIPLLIERHDQLVILKK